MWPSAHKMRVCLVAEHSELTVFACEPQRDVSKIQAPPSTPSTCYRSTIQSPHLSRWTQKHYRQARWHSASVGQAIRFPALENRWIGVTSPLCSSVQTLGDLQRRLEQLCWLRLRMIWRLEHTQSGLHWCVDEPWLQEPAPGRYYHPLAYGSHEIS